MKELSFCITCKNRLPQIFQTLKQNLADNQNFSKRIEFILVDFNSTDGLEDYILKNFFKEISEGYLKYFHTKALEHWHASIGKNTAHILAEGEIVVNLDCDNFTGVNGADFVLEQFNKYGEKIVLHQASGQMGDGSYGRIATHKNYFMQIGGYDESFNPMGYQDVDLIQRLTAFGLFYIVKSDFEYNRAIVNTKEDGLKYANSQKSYTLMLQENKLISSKNIRNNKLIVNNGNFGISKDMIQCLP